MQNFIMIFQLKFCFLMGGAVFFSNTAPAATVKGENPQEQPNNILNMDHRNAFEMIRQGDLKALRLFIKKSGTLNHRDTKRNGRTLLMEAVMEGKTDIVQWLLQAGTDINAQNNMGWTALMLSTQSPRTKMVSLLLKSGANIHITSNMGWTAFMWAAEYRSVPIMKKLLQRGADINTQDASGDTALMRAARQGTKYVASFLLENGANPNLLNNKGELAIQMLDKNRIHEMQKMLTPTIHPEDLKLAKDSASPPSSSPFPWKKEQAPSEKSTHSEESNQKEVKSFQDVLDLIMEKTQDLTHKQEEIPDEPVKDKTLALNPREVAPLNNPPFLPFKDIYGSQSSQHLPSLKRVEELVNQPYRVMVTTLGSGVDYNHPGLSYKILRPRHIQPEAQIKSLVKRVEYEIQVKVNTLVDIKKKIKKLEKQKQEAQNQASILIPGLSKKRTQLIQEKTKMQKTAQERSNAQFRLAVSLAQMFTNHKDTKIKETDRQIQYIKSRPDHIQQEIDLLKKLKLQALRKELKETMGQWIQTLKEGAIAWDFEDQDPYPYMDTTQENHLTGTLIHLAASHNDENISLLPLRISSPFRAGDLYKAVALAYAKGSRIVNISFWTRNEKSIKSLYRAIKDYPDMLFIASAGEGNNNIDLHPIYPASWGFPHLLVVTSQDTETGFSSSYGEQSVDMAVEPFSLLQSMNKKWANSTSNIIHDTEDLPSKNPLMAAAMVTRLAAQVKYINPLLNPLQIIQILSESVVHTKKQEEKCKFPGVLNEEKALNLAKQYTF